MDSSSFGLLVNAVAFLGAGIWHIIRAKEMQRSEIARYESTPKSWVDRLNRSPRHRDWVKSPGYVLFTRLVGAACILIGLLATWLLLRQIFR